MNDARTESMTEGYEVTRPKLAFYHPNANGTGCAIILELYPATKEHEGFILCSFANQMTFANPTYPKFDWENGVVVRLWFDDLTHILQVLRGETESICDGKGLYSKIGGLKNLIQLKHIVEPACGYNLSIIHREDDGNEIHHSIFFSNAEALGLLEVISGSMYLIAFGKPMVVSVV